jgi:hypothetical protein
MTLVLPEEEDYVRSVCPSNPGAVDSTEPAVNEELKKVENGRGGLDGVVGEVDRALSIT